MKRIRMEKAELKSWEEVDQALKAIAEAQNEISIVEAGMNLQIDEIKKAYDEKIRSYKDNIKKQELLIKDFSSGRRDDMKGKSRELTFGTVGFRKSTKLVLPKTLARVVASLKKAGMADCVTVKETVNKDILKTYPEQDILKVGGSLKVEDTFWYETKSIALSKEV